MKLKDILDNIDKSDQNSSYPNIEEIVGDIRGYGLGYPEEENTRLMSYFFAKSYCTDTWVGWKAYFLDDTPVAISHQPYRKSSEEFKWLSDEGVKNTIDYLMTLYEPADMQADIIDASEFDKELGLGHRVEYGENLLTKDVIYEPTMKLVKVTKTWGLRDGIGSSENWSKVIIEHEDGKKEGVSMSDIIVPYTLKD